MRKLIIILLLNTIIPSAVAQRLAIDDSFLDRDNGVDAYDASWWTTSASRVRLK